MYKDEEIEFRVFDYGYRYALKTREGKDILMFPEPRVIQLYKNKGISDVKSILLDFGTQGTFEYKVPVYKLLEHSLEELNQRRMVILVPFMMLKLRDSLQKERTPENMEALRKLILDDIIGIISENQSAGNITSTDANKLRGLIQKLYNHLYAHYEELVEGGWNDMMEEGIVLEADIIEAEVTKRVTKEVTEQVTKEVTKRVTKEVTEQVTKKVNEKNQKDTIRKLYSKLKDKQQVADLLDLPLDVVQQMV